MPKGLKYTIAGILIFVGIVLVILFFATSSREHDSGTGPNGGSWHITSGGNKSYYQTKTNNWGPENSNIGFVIGAVFCLLLGIGAIFIPEPKSYMKAKYKSNQKQTSNIKSIVKNKKVKTKKAVKTKKEIPTTYWKDGERFYLDCKATKQELIVLIGDVPASEIREKIKKQAKVKGLDVKYIDKKTYVQEPTTQKFISIREFKDKYVTINN